jgi:hypothetical protein
VSHYAQGKTLIVADGLLEALREMGLEPEASTTLRALTGYERGRQAHVILSQAMLQQRLPAPYGQHVLGDLGFVLNPDGSVEAVVDNWGPRGANSGMFTPQWFGELAKLSRIHAMLKQAKKRGQRAVRDRDDRGRDRVRVYA